MPAAQARSSSPAWRPAAMAAAPAPTRAGVLGMARTTATPVPSGGLDGRRCARRRRSTGPGAAPAAAASGGRRPATSPGLTASTAPSAAGGALGGHDARRGARRQRSAAGLHRLDDGQLAGRRPARRHAGHRRGRRPCCRHRTPPAAHRHGRGTVRRVRASDPERRRPHFPDTRPAPPRVRHGMCARASPDRKRRPTRAQRGSGRRSRCAAPGGSSCSTWRTACRAPGRARRSSSTADGQLAPEEHGVLGPDREVGADQPVVAPQQVLVELGVVLLGRRHHVGLVAQGALAEREPHRGEVLLLAAHPHVPAALARLAPVDGGDHRVVGPGRRPATRRCAARGRRARRRRTGRTCAHEQATSDADGEVGVEAAQAGGGERPRVAAAAGGGADAHLPGQARRSPAARRCRRRTPRGRDPRTRKPVWPWSTSVSRPPTAAATTGVPQAAASRATRPKLSERDGHQHHVGGAVPARQEVVGLRRHEADPVAEAELVDQGEQLLDLGVAVDAAGPAHDHQHGVGPVEVRRGPARPRRRPSAAGCGRRTAAPGGRRGRGRWRAPRRSPGAKKACSTPGRDDLDAPGRVAVEPAELAAPPRCSSRRWRRCSR